MSTTATKMVVWPAHSGATICPETLPAHSANQPTMNTTMGFAGLFFAISRSMIHISTSAVMKPENTIDSGTFSELENKKTSAAKLASITL